MRSLSASELLNAWERALTQAPAQRALTLLIAAYPETPLETLAKLSIGQRDALLLTLREGLFGAQLLSLATCPSCGDLLELAFAVADIRATPPAKFEETFSVHLADYEVQFRLPNSLDLLACVPEKAIALHDPAAAQRVLLERCLLAAHHQGENQLLDQLPGEVVAAIVTHMAEADPQADVQLDLSCPACGHHWQAIFDILAFLWSEIHAWALRTLREVHILASAYSWQEADILMMSPYRRRLYLELVGK